MASITNIKFSSLSQRVLSTDTAVVAHILSFLPMNDKEWWWDRTQRANIYKGMSKVKTLATCHCFKNAAKMAFEIFLRTASTIECFTPNVGVYDLRKFSRCFQKKAVANGYVVSRLENVSKLILRDEEFSRKSDRDDTIESLLRLRKFDKLTELTIVLQFGESPQVSETTFETIAAQCPGLRKFRCIYEKDNLPGSAVEKLGGLKYLESVDFGGKCSVLNDSTLEGLSKISTLTDVCLRDCSKATHVGIGILLHSLPNLRVLDISGNCGNGQSNYEQQAELALAVATHGTQLTSLNMSGGYYQTLPILEIAKNCQNLTKLDISFNHHAALPTPLQVAQIIKDVKPKLTVAIGRHHCDDNETTPEFLEL